MRESVGVCAVSVCLELLLNSHLIQFTCVSRRLPVIMVRMKMAPTVKDATVMVEQGHVRVGPDCITDPAYLVTRTLEDYVTWTRQSSYREKIMRYNDQASWFVIFRS